MERLLTDSRDTGHLDGKLKSDTEEKRSEIGSDREELFDWVVIRMFLAQSNLNFLKLGANKCVVDVTMCVKSGQCLQSFLIATSAVKGNVR